MARTRATPSTRRPALPVVAALVSVLLVLLAGADRPSSAAGGAAATSTPPAGSTVTTGASGPAGAGSAGAAGATAPTVPTGRPLSTMSTARLARDATGLTGAGLVAAPPLALRGSAADGTALFAVRSRGERRTYLLAPARRVAPGTAPGLLILLPAANTALRSNYDRYGLDALRDHGLTVLVAGTYAGSWNAGRCCGMAYRDGIDDVAAVTALRDDALRRSGANPARIAVVGHSVGGLMAWRLACTPRFGAAAVVSVSGTLVAPCPMLPAPPAFLDVHGERDATVPVHGSSRRSTLLGLAPPPVHRSLQRLAAAGGCRPAGPGRYDGCRGGRSVRLEVLPGLGHGWLEMDATRRVSAFLSDSLAAVG